MSRKRDGDYHKAWNARNPEKVRKYQATYRARAQEYIRARRTSVTQAIYEFCRYIKEQTPCVDCGRRDKHYAMEFDHLPNTGPRVCSPSASGGWGRCHREIAKCEVVCARCHRVRTWVRRGEET